MSVVVTMKGALESVTIDEDYTATLHTFNLTAAQGKKFASTKTEDGDDLLINIDEVLTAREEISAV